MVENEEQKNEDQSMSVQKFKSISELKEFFASNENEILASMATQLDPARLLQVFIGSMSVNPKLWTCTKQSLIRSLIECGRANLWPDSYSREAYLVPFRNNKKSVMECVMMPGYMGILKLAKNSGDVAKATVQIVYSGDNFSFQYGTEPYLKHIPTFRDKGELVAVYAIVHFRDHNIAPEIKVMSIEDCRAHGERFTKSKKEGQVFGLWKDDIEAASMKTVLKRALKYIPLSTTASEVIQRDDLRDLGKDVLDIPLPSALSSGEEKPKTKTEQFEEAIDNGTRERPEDEPTDDGPPNDKLIAIDDYLDSKVITRSKDTEAIQKEKVLRKITKLIFDAESESLSVLTNDAIDTIYDYLRKEKLIQ